MKIINRVLKKMFIFFSNKKKVSKEEVKINMILFLFIGFIKKWNNI